jgi:hypothetical protein
VNTFSDAAIQDEMFETEPEVPPEPVTERMVLDALHEHYGQIHNGAARCYAVAEHVRTAPFTARRTADFMAMDTWKSNRYDIHGHEIKVSRSDWLAELRDPGKAGEFIPYVNRWWLVVGFPGIVKPGELPVTWGLMVFRKGIIEVKRQAPRSPAEQLPQERLAALLRAVQKTAATQALREVSP